MYLLSCVGLVALLLIASLFSFLETASVAISEHRLISLNATCRWANYALRLKQQLDKVLIFSLFGNSFFNALVTMLSTMLVLHLFGDGHQLILSLATLFVTLMIIIFSEATPKIIASKNPLLVLRLISIPLYYLFILSKPLIWLIDKIVYLITRALGIGYADGTSLDELKALVADKRSPFLDSHRSILLNSLELEQLTVKEVIIPLRNVEMIDLDAGINELREKLQQSHHTRVVVYQGTIDNILGYVHTKDVLTLTCGAYSKHELSLLIRKINFIPDFILIVKQLRMAQNKRERLFMVVNEYGDLLGLACLEDMLEIVFGDFTTDAPHRNYLMIKEDNGSFIVDGATLVREFNEAYQLDLPFSYDAMSINGLIMKQLSTIPVCGVCFRLDNISFEVLQVGKFWAERVRISSIQSR